MDEMKTSALGAESGQEMKKAVIFDMDGVIFDSESLYIECWKQVGIEYDLADVEEMSHKMIGINEAHTRIIFDEYYRGTRDYDVCRPRVSELFHERSANGLPVKPGVYEMVCFLKENHIPVALASSTGIRTVTRELKEAGLDQAFNCVIGGDMIKKSKPEPDIFLAAAGELGFAPEKCYVLEDSYNGIRAASAAGMHPIMIPDLLEPTEEMRRLAEYICDTLYEAEEYLKGVLL